LIKILFLFFITFLVGCQTSNLFEDVKKDFAVEKKVTVFDKTNKNRQFQIPLNGMILVNKDETIYSIANKYKVVPKDIISDNNLIEPYNLKEYLVFF
jgi:hypothetical protein